MEICDIHIIYCLMRGMGSRERIETGAHANSSRYNRRHHEHKVTFAIIYIYRIIKRKGNPDITGTLVRWRNGDALLEREGEGGRRG